MVPCAPTVSGTGSGGALMVPCAPTVSGTGWGALVVPCAPTVSGTGWGALVVSYVPTISVTGWGLWWSPVPSPTATPLSESGGSPGSGSRPQSRWGDSKNENALRASGARRWGGGGRGTESSGVSVVPRGPDKAGGRALSLGTPRESPALCRSGGMRARLAGAGLVPCPGPPEAVPYQWANQGRLGSAPVRPQGVGR